MDLRNVAVFVEAVANGSLAAAGRRLGIGAMAASRRLAGLEEDLGIRLFHRSTRTLSLTPEGEHFLPHARAMLEEEREARAALRPAGAGASGLLRVTSSFPFGRRVLAPMIPGFMRDNPEVRVELLMTDDIVDIIGQGIDLAIRIAKLRDSNLVARRLADNPLGLYAAPAYLAEHGIPARMADLEAHACVTVTGVSHWELRGPQGRAVRQRVSGRFSASSVEGVYEACRGGLGIAHLSRWIVADEIRAGGIVEIALEDAQADSFAVWAVHPSARLVPPKVRMFASAVEAVLKGR